MGDVGNYSGATPGAGSGNVTPPPGEQAEASVSPAARSWSQYDQYRKCPKSFELARIRRVPRRPGAWLPAGTAFHSAIEAYLRQRLEETMHA